MINKILSKAILQLSVTHAPVLIPWFRPLLKKHCDSARIHRIYLSDIPMHPETLSSGSAKKIKYTIKQICFTLSWPFTSAVYAFHYAKLHGNVLKKEHNIPLYTQFLKTWKLGLFYNFPAEVVYQNRLFTITNNKDLINYLYTDQMGSILHFLNRHVDLSELDDKILFHEKMNAVNLPTVPIIVGFVNKKTTWFSSEERLPAENLFAKFANSCCGNGAEKWTFNAEHSHWEYASEMLNEKELIERFIRRSSKNPVIVQPAISNHPSIDCYAPGVLCTLRITTYHQPEGSVKPIFAAFRMPTNSKNVDNFHAGGIAAGINEQGILSSAVSLKPDSSRFSQHPTTGTQIEGTELVQWDESLQLVSKAHAQFPDVRMIGWDVALTPNGAILVEANSAWCVKVLQIPNQTSILNKDLSQFFFQSFNQVNGSVN